MAVNLLKLDKKICQHYLKYGLKKNNRPIEVKVLDGYKATKKWTSNKKNVGL